MVDQQPPQHFYTGVETPEVAVTACKGFEVLQPFWHSMIFQTTDSRYRLEGSSSKLL